MSGVSSLVLHLLLALCSTPDGGADEDAARPPAPPVAGAAGRVDLSVDFDEERLTVPLKHLLERAVPIFAELTGRELPAHRSLVINLFESISTYRRTTGAVGVSSFMDVGAVTSWSTGQSYLAVQPSPHPRYLAAAGWQPELLLQLCLHEGMHQYMATAGMAATTTAPTWYSEGFADYAAEHAMRTLLETPAHGFLMLDDAREQVARAVAEGRSIPLGELFALRAVDIDRRDDRSLFYDQSRSVVEFLAAGGAPRWRETFHAYRDALDTLQGATRDLGPGRALDRSHELWFELVEDMDALERDWKASVRPTGARWLEAHGSSQWKGDELLVASVRWLEKGYAVSAEPAPLSPRRFEAEVCLLGAALEGQAYVVLATDAAGTAGVRLDLDLERRLAKLVSWGEGRVSTRGLEIPAFEEQGEFVPLSIEIQGRSLAIRVGDGPPIEASVPEDHPAPGGAWGLGVWRDAARWRNVSYR